MGKINWARVIAGGLVAGLVINAVEAFMNTVVLSEAWAEVMRGMGKSGELGGGQIAFFNLLGFLVGGITIWLYAAIRPRYGPGPRTAVCAGIAVWLLWVLIPALFMMAIDLFPAHLLWIGNAYALGELIAGALAGAWIYRE